MKELRRTLKMTYEKLLGKEQWDKLHPEIKQRFSLKPEQSITYQGKMREVYCSTAGKLLANFCRIIGGPLALHRGKNINVTVKVYPNKKHGGLTWDRFYHFPKKPINRVKSTKCIKQDIGLVEMVGFSFGMKLKVSENKGAIVFESTQFFWQLPIFSTKRSIRIPIPDLLSPGKTIVSQTALADNKFEFRLDVTHRLLGKVFMQVGEFKECDFYRHF